MNTREELLFTESLICAFRLSNVETIPFANNLFMNGVEKLKEFLLTLRNDYKIIDEIETLFVKSPFEGNFDRLKKAFESYNGSRLSFSLENPRYEKASIKTPIPVAQNLLHDFSNEIPEKTMLEAARHFCEGAKMPC